MIMITIIINNIIYNPPSVNKNISFIWILFYLHYYHFPHIYCLE